MNRTIKMHYRAKVPNVFVLARTVVSKCNKNESCWVLSYHLVLHESKNQGAGAGGVESFELFPKGRISKQNMTQVSNVFVLLRTVVLF